MNQLQHLARVRDEDLAGQASGAGARALLPALTAEEPGSRPSAVVTRRTHRARRTRRVLAGALAAGALVAAAVVGPAVLGTEGIATSYANSAMDIRLEGDYYVAVIKNPLADYAEFTEGFKAVGLNVRLRPVPSSPSQVGQVTGVSAGPGGGAGTASWHPNDDRRIGTGTSPAGCDLARSGCSMTVLVRRDYRGDGVVKLGRPARPGEKYQNLRPATAEGEMLEGFRVDEKTVGEVRAEIDRRGLKAVFEVITPAPGNNGWRVDPAEQTAEVGDDWIVWEARSERQGVVRLQVTKERLPKNPIYGGPKPTTYNG
ncbi:hypothetical protein GCM10009733_025230 [Nonomuraea maheshkhaliensis]|uniref:Uncharacterized protein n=1 Tax=Nonomuraea maheshkhaliensis TaxID=419590 RepID=A0ABN2F279_9ACTN